jgi:hypothetical protein
MTSCPAPVLVDAADPPDAAELVDPDPPLVVELLLPQPAKTATTPTVTAMRNFDPDFNIGFTLLSPAAIASVPTQSGFTSRVGASRPPGYRRLEKRAYLSVLVGFTRRDCVQKLRPGETPVVGRADAPGILLEK